MLSNLVHELFKAFYILLSLPKSIFFNIYYLPLHQAIKLPILISHHVKLRYMGGSVQVDQASFGIVQIGFNSFGDIAGVSGAWALKGRIFFQGKTRIGCNPIIQINGNVDIGKDFEAGHNLLLLCDKTITIGQGVLLSWHVELMDTDSHEIYDSSQIILNPPSAVTIQDNSWLGSHVCVLKGSYVPMGSIVASHAMVTKKFQNEHTLLIGSPARIQNTHVYWKP